MKFVLLSLAFVFWQQVCFSQNTILMPDSDAVWVNTYEFYETPIISNEQEPIWSEVFNYCVSGLDTNISGQLYNQIHHCGSDYKGAFRQFDDAVYFIPRDSTQEYLLYDFGVAVGDSLYDVYRESPLGWSIDPFDLEVVSVDTQFVYGRQRKVIQFFDGVWIEGVGNSQGLFWDSWTNVSGINLNLECFSYLDTSYTLGGYELSNGSCSLNVGLEEEPILENLVIFPNPTLGPVEIDLPGKTVTAVNVFNPLGRFAKQYSSNSSRVRIELPDVSGCYYLQIICSDQRSYYRKIVVQ